MPNRQPADLSRAVTCTNGPESGPAIPAKSRLAAAPETSISSFNKKIKLDPRRVPSAEYDEPRCQVHRILIFFKPPNTLPFQKAKLYQYSGVKLISPGPQFLRLP